VDQNGHVDFSRPVRRLTETQALDLLHPDNPRSSPKPPTGWFTRLAAILTRLFRRN